MNEDPPIAPPPPSPDEGPAAPSDPENLFAVALAKSSNDSFPVLNAFQTFLDQERERARRRVVTMAVCFTGAMIVLLLVFGILFAMFFSRMMVRNEQQQDRLLDLVARGIPAAVHEAGYSAPGAEADESVPREEILRVLQQLAAERAGAARGAAPAAPAAAQPLPAGLVPVPASAPRSAPQPATVIPSSVVPFGSDVSAGVAVPSSPARDDLVAAPPPRTGVLSSPFRRDQEIKEAAEEAARRARAAAVQAARDAAAQVAAPAPAPQPQALPPAPAPAAARDDLAEGFVTPAQAAAASRDDLAEGAPGVPAPEPAPVVPTGAPAGPLPFALPAGAAPTAAVGPVPLGSVDLAPPAAPAAPAAGRRSIAVKPVSRMSVPSGFSSDRTEVETASGSRIPFRLLVPVPNASR